MNYNPFSLEYKRILITGAGSGIGRSIAIEAAKMGAILLLVDINIDALNETVGMLDGKSSVSCPLKPSDSAPLKHSTMPP